MTAALTTLRASLASDLASAGNWSTYSFPPSILTANSVVVTPADPYVIPSNNTNNINPLANFKILMCVPLLDNQGNLNGVETMLVGVFQKLMASTLVINVGSTSAPAVLSAASGDLLSCEINVSILTTWT